MLYIIIDLIIFFEYIKVEANYQILSIVYKMSKQVNSHSNKQVNKQSNKVHKTLRDKLRKRRQQLKSHKKEKSEKRKLFDPIEQKQKYFMQKNKVGTQQQIKVKKVVKYIQKFINIYEDDLQDFYDIFQTFEQGGQIDIAELQNKSIQKCLKKMFKYLPLKRKKMVYSKNPQTKINLEAFMKNQVSSVIENYLQNGTQDEDDKKGSSSEEQNENKVTKKQIKQAKMLKKQKHNKKEKQQSNIDVQIKEPLIIGPSLGPFISFQERQKIAECFDKQIEEMRAEQIQKQKQEQNQFDRIFGMSTSRNKKNNNIVQEVPDSLLAEGSARIGEKLDIQDGYFEKYDKQFRPKKLIDEHRQMMQINAQTQKNQNKTRKPFDRQRDIIDGPARHSAMKNGVFFDFKDRMTKPKKTNNFL